MMLSRDLRYMDAIRLKVYVEPKTLEDWRVTSFVDASKMLYSRAYLAWRSEDLCALYFHRLANTPHQIGQAFRDMAQGLGFVLRDLPSGARLLPHDLQIDAAQQALLFNRFFPLVAYVGKSKSRNAYQHLCEMMEEDSKHLNPRDFTKQLSYFVAFLRVAGSGAASLQRLRARADMELRSKGLLPTRSKGLVRARVSEEEVLAAAFYGHMLEVRDGKRDLNGNPFLLWRECLS